VPGSPVSTRASPVADWAASGIVALTGRPEGPPLVPPGRAATVARELGARIATVTAGTRVSVQVDGAQLLADRAALTGHRRAETVSAGGSCRLLPTADGWAAVSCARPDDSLLLGALVERALPEDLWPAVEGPRAWTLRCVRGGVSPYVSDRDARRLEAARCPVVTIEGAGHFLHAERPQAVIDAVAAGLG